MLSPATQYVSHASRIAAAIMAAGANFRHRPPPGSRPAVTPLKHAAHSKRPSCSLTHSRQ
jgi:hypothetical protein